MTVELPTRADRFQAALLSWAEDHKRAFPWRETHRSRYEVFIAEFFLTQTPAANVADLYDPFLEAYPDLEAIAAASMSELAAAIEPIGFHNMRAESLSQIATQYDELPGTPEELQDLPRVGNYVANATLCIAHERRLPIVDRNVSRTYKRLFGTAFPETPTDRRQFAELMLPGTGTEARTFNLALLDFGAELCTKRDPSCDQCFANADCVFASERRT
jgi:A/G-specific adenine glycosylase